MNRGMMRHTYEKLSPIRAHVRIKAPTGTRTGTDLVGGGAVIQDSLQVNPSDHGIPHLVLGPKGFLSNSSETGSVCLFPTFTNTSQVQFVVARMAGLDDSNNGFRYVVINNGCAYIDSVTLGPLANNAHVHIGSTNITTNTFLGVGLDFPALQSDIKAQLHVSFNFASSASTAALTQIMETRATTAGLTPTAGFGGIFQFLLQSSTTNGRNAGSIQTTWVVATDASRTNRVALFASDSAADREVMRIEADGTAGRLGFYAATAVIQQATTGNVHTVTAGSTTNVFTNTTFDGSTGSTAYTVGDIVKALKAYGLLAA